MSKAVVFIPSDWQAVRNHEMVSKIRDSREETRIVFVSPTRYILTVGFKKPLHRICSTYLVPLQHYDEKPMVEDVAAWLGTTIVNARTILHLRG